MSDRFITVAIHTYEKAVALRSMLESEGIKVEFRNVNIEHPVVSSGVRVRISENDLPLALRIIENHEIFTVPKIASDEESAHNVLVPVDFSERSLNAAAYAFRIAQMHKTGITLLHTYIDPYLAGNMQLTDSLTYEITESTTREQIKSMAETQMRHFSAKLKELIKSGDLPGVNFRTRVEEGVPEDTITEYARVNNPFMIVMGTRGPRKKEAEVIGSVTAEVLDKCRNSVLAIPEPDGEDAPAISLDNVIFLGSTDQQDILALDTLHRIYPDVQAKVTVASLPPKKRQFMRDTKRALEAICDYCRNNFKGYTFTSLELKRETAIEELRSINEQKKYSLIVVPNRKKNVFSRFFNPSLAHRLLFVSEIPILVIPV